MAMTLKFVDQPVATPATLFDLNDKIDAAIDMGQTFDISPPPLKKSVSGNNMQDGGQLTAAAYQNRILQFDVQLGPQGAHSVSQKEQLLTELTMELSKPSNLLMYKASPTSAPIFFQTIRSDSYVVNSGGGSRKGWNLRCQVEALPFGLGVRHSIVNGVTITNDPASGTNPARLDITGVKGDAPAPAFINLGASFGATSYFIFSQRTRDTTITPFVQAESGTLGTDTTLPGNDAAFSGAGSNYARTSFTTATMTTRLTLTIPTQSKGTYRIFARIRNNTATTTYQVQTNFPGTSSFSGPIVEFSLTSGAISVIDLGLFDFPFPAAAPSQFGYSRLAASSYPAQTMQIQAARTSGTGTLDFDYLYFMPADERLLTIQGVAALGRIIIDGPNERAYGMSSGSDPFGVTRVLDNAGALVPSFGGFPNLVPGVTNRWFMMRAKNHVITNTYVISVDYWPQYRVVALP
jgi:hypothetical protein